VVVIDESVAHHHVRAKECYLVDEGELSLFVEGIEHVLHEGEEFTVMPGQVHWARGNATRVFVDSYPGWTQEDHILDNVPTTSQILEEFKKWLMRLPEEEKEKTVIRRGGRLYHARAILQALETDDEMGRRLSSAIQRLMFVK
jgi:hypothetical protein